MSKMAYDRFSRFRLPSMVFLAVFISAVANAAKPVHGRPAEDLLQLRLGIFIHWVGPSPDQSSAICLSDGTLPRDIDAFADSVDVARVAREVADMRFQYVVLTDFHGLGTTLHPCPALDRWRGKGFAAKRDLINEFNAQLANRGIRLILFTHPLDGHDFTPDQKKRLGWDDPADHYRRWNDFINDVYADIANRYGDEIAGMGFDSEFSLSGDERWKGKLDLPRLRQTLKAHHPGLRLIALAGPNDTCEMGMKEVWRPSWLDPWASRHEDDYDVESWPAYRRMVAVVEGFHWATIRPPAGGLARLNGDQLFRYTVLQAGTATEGPGVAWAASPYTDGTWEHGVHDAFTTLAGHVAPVAESLRNVYPSTAYPAAEGSRILDLDHGIVATRSTNSRFEYVHVLNPPADRVLNLPPPADGKQFTSAARLADGHLVGLAQDSNGIHLTLEKVDTWDKLDTVIKLVVDPASIAPRNLAFHKPVFCSSSVEIGINLADRSDWGQIRLVDGQTHVVARAVPWSCGNAGWSSASLPTDHREFVGVDLGEIDRISSVCLHPRDDGENAGYGFPLDLVIQTSPDREIWKTVETKTDVPLPRRKQLYPVEAQARYVRILATHLRRNPHDANRYAFQLVELEVFGEP